MLLTVVLPDRQTYGPIFRCLVGTRRIVVICDNVGVQAILRDKLNLLETTRRGLERSVGGIDSEIGHHFSERLFPITADALSSTNLPPLLCTFSHSLAHRLEKVSPAGSNPQHYSLFSFVGDILHSTISAAVLGDSFPASAFSDLEIMNKGFFYIVSGIPFLSAPGMRARERLRRTVAEYIENTGPSCGAGTLPEPAVQILSTLSDLQLTPSDRNGVFLFFVWGLHATLIRSAFWMMTYLLNDPDAIGRLRAEINKAIVEGFLDINALLKDPVGLLDGPQFTLLDSTVNETLRLSTTAVLTRQAREDIVVSLSNGDRFPIRKGELVAASIRAVQSDPLYYDDPFQFRADRFLDNGGVEKSQFVPWGGGKHIVSPLSMLGIHE